MIALVFGAVGYATTEPDQAPLPPLPVADTGVPAAQGEITSVSGDRITLVTANGASLDYALLSDATVEALEPIELASVRIGDWFNGGAIPHPDTVLALVSLILLPEPVTP